MNGTTSSCASPRSSTGCGSWSHGRVPCLHPATSRTPRYPGDVELRRLRGELVLGWAAAAVGAIGVASALTPEFADRSDFVRGVLPPGFPGAARVLVLTFGLTLIWLSRSLAHRRRRAWQLAGVLVVGLASFHLAKGLDVEEASLSLLVLAALYRF